MKNKASIHLICGFLGFGKTTYAKKLERELPATRFTHDEIMLQRYGRCPDNFQKKYKEVDEFIRKSAVREIQNGKNVILDYGFWSRQKRSEYYKWATTITPNVYFHSVTCSLEIAKKRIEERTKNNFNELYISESCFNEFLGQYEPLIKEEGYPVIFYFSE